MKTGFLIVNYNDYETTSKLLSNIQDYELLDMIVVVDNNSSDDSYELLKKLETSKIKVIKTEENKGYGYGINCGSKFLIENLKKCYIIVSNPDVEIGCEEDLKALIDSFDSKTDMVGPIIKEHDGLNRGWKIPTPMQDVVLNLPYIHRKLRPKMLFYNDEYFKGIVEVEAVSGCFFVIRSDSLKEANYFDENVFLYYEENIISKRLKNKIKINSDVLVFHNHSVTIDKNINRIKKYKELKKSEMYFQKTYNKANLLERFLLFLTDKFMLLCLYIRSLF